MALSIFSWPSSISKIPLLSSFSINSCGNGDFGDSSTLENHTFALYNSCGPEISKSVVENEFITEKLTSSNISSHSTCSNYFHGVGLAANVEVGSYTGGIDMDLTKLPSRIKDFVISFYAIMTGEDIIISFGSSSNLLLLGVASNSLVLSDFQGKSEVLLNSFDKSKPIGCVVYVEENKSFHLAVFYATSSNPKLLALKDFSSSDLGGSNLSTISISMNNNNTILQSIAMFVNVGMKSTVTDNYRYFLLRRPISYIEYGDVDMYQANISVLNQSTAPIYFAKGPGYSNSGANFITGISLNLDDEDADSSEFDAELRYQYDAGMTTDIPILNNDLYYGLSETYSVYAILKDIRTTVVRSALTFPEIYVTKLNIKTTLAKNNVLCNYYTVKTIYCNNKLVYRMANYNNGKFIYGKTSTFSVDLKNPTTKEYSIKRTYDINNNPVSYIDSNNKIPSIRFFGLGYLDQVPCSNISIPQLYGEKYRITINGSYRDVTVGDGSGITN